MTASIPVDESLDPLHIPGPVLNEALAHARQAFPEECCGLFTGTPSQRFGRCHPCANDMSVLHKRDPQRHPQDNRHGFHMREADYLRVLGDAEGRGEQVSGVYHSHAGAEVYFSDIDQAYARQPLFPFPEADHIVISVVDQRVMGVGAFRWSSERGSFEGRRVEGLAP